MPAAQLWATTLREKCPNTDQKKFPYLGTFHADTCHHSLHYFSRYKPGFCISPWAFDHVLFFNYMLLFKFTQGYSTYRSIISKDNILLLTLCFNDWFLKLLLFLYSFDGVYSSLLFSVTILKVFLLFHFSFYLKLGYKKFLYRLFQESSWCVLPTYSPFHNFSIGHNPSIKHCVKSVRIWSYSAPHFSRIFPAFSRIQALFRQWRKMQCHRNLGSCVL